MPSDDLALGWRLSGLSVDEAWQSYLAIGGDRSRSEFLGRLRGAPWPDRDDVVLAVVVDEALREAGLPSVRASDPASTQPEPPGPPGPPGPRPLEEAGALPAPPAAGGGTPVAARFEDLARRAALTRAAARLTRDWARAVRGSRGTPTGGR